MRRAQRGSLDRAEMIGCLKRELLKLGLTIYLISPTSLKKFISLHGHADKSDMIANAHHLTGITPLDDNAADALGLCAYGEALLWDRQSLEYTQIQPLNLR